MGTMMVNLLATASDVATEVAKKGPAAGGVGPGAVLLGVVALLLTSSVIANIVTAAMTSLRASAEIRRQRYAAAVELLAARIEFPYRIRRRTSDEPQTLTKLADIGHDLQQQLAQSRAWVTAENAVMGEVFDACIAALDEPFKNASRDAWDSDAVTGPKQMNLNGFGMGEQQHVLASMQRALVYRFGWRRLISNGQLRRLLTQKGSLPAPAEPNAQQTANPAGANPPARRTDEAGT
jgi:hypothetical protein